MLWIDPVEHKGDCFAGSRDLLQEHRVSADSMAMELAKVGRVLVVG